MFTIDNRPDFNGTKRLACQQITPSQCGACLVEDDAAAGKDCMGKCFGYAMKTLVHFVLVGHQGKI